MEQNNQTDIRNTVRKRYSSIASQNDPGENCCSSSSCCTPSSSALNKSMASDIFSYSRDDLSGIPEKALMDLGCGNPGALARIAPRETILDLGSGGGIDCFIASKMTGDKGTVIGVDMTPEMLERARINAIEFGSKNVEFRLGEIENLPVADNTVDVIISNCVINLSHDKSKVFAEVYRVLKPGGRLAISDMVATSPLPDEITSNMELYAGCLAGAVFIEKLQSMINEAGFHDIKIQFENPDLVFSNRVKKDAALEDIVKSASIEAIKPFPVSTKDQ